MQQQQQTSSVPNPLTVNTNEVQERNDEDNEEDFIYSPLGEQSPTATNDNANAHGGGGGNNNSNNNNGGNSSSSDHNNRQNSRASVDDDDTDGPSSPSAHMAEASSPAYRFDTHREDITHTGNHNNNSDHSHHRSFLVASIPPQPSSTQLQESDQQQRQQQEVAATAQLTSSGGSSGGVNRPTTIASASTLCEVPSEALLCIMKWSDARALSCLQITSKRLRLVFLVYCIDHLWVQYSPRWCDWTMLDAMHPKIIKELSSERHSKALSGQYTLRHRFYLERASRPLRTALVGAPPLDDDEAALVPLNNSASINNNALLISSSAEVATATAVDQREATATAATSEAAAATATNNTQQPQPEENHGEQPTAREEERGGQQQEDDDVVVRTSNSTSNANDEGEAIAADQTQTTAAAATTRVQEQPEEHDVNTTASNPLLPSSSSSSSAAVAATAAGALSATNILIDGNAHVVGGHEATQSVVRHASTTSLTVGPHSGGSSPNFQQPHQQQHYSTLVPDEKLEVLELTKPTPQDHSKRIEAERRRAYFRYVWFREVRYFRNVRHNIKSCLFNYVTVEKQSHAVPLLLPNGTVLFSRWQQISVYIRTRDKYKDQRTYHNEGNRWIKVGYLNAHSDTVSSMQYHAPSNTVLTSSLDGSVRRWTLRRDDGEKPDHPEPVMKLNASYHIHPLGPNSQLYIFSFDWIDLDDPDDVNANSSLLCCGTESGHLIMHHLGGKQNTYLGLYNSQEMRIRHLRFINKHPFVKYDPHDQLRATPSRPLPEVPAGQNTEVGVVYVAMSAMGNVHIVRHVVFRHKQKVEFTSTNSNGETSVRRAGWTYTYTVPFQTMERLMILPIGDSSLQIDVPPLCFPSIYFRVTNVNNVPGWSKVNPYRSSPVTQALKAIKEVEPPKQRTLPLGNPYLSNPACLVIVENHPCWVYTLNPTYAPEQDPLQLVFRQHMLPQQVDGATCAKFSPCSAFVAVGMPNGAIVLLVVWQHKRPSFAATNNSNNNNNAAAAAVAGERNEDVTVRSREAETTVATEGSASVQTSGEDIVRPTSATATAAGGGDVATPLSPADTATATATASAANNAQQQQQQAPQPMSLSDFALFVDADVEQARATQPFWGPLAHDDPFCQQLLESEKGPLLEDPTTGLIPIVFAPKHATAVASITLDSWKLTSIDKFSTVYVFDLETKALLWYVTQRQDPQTCHVVPNSTFDRILSLDVAAHQLMTRTVQWRNGTMLVSPLAITHHSLIADFSPLMQRDPSLKEAHERRHAGCSRRKPFNERPRTADSEKPGNAVRGDTTITQKSTVSRVQAQPFVFGFHLCYVVGPPVVCLLLDIFIVVLCLRLDQYISLRYAVVFLLHAILVPYYIGINVYCFKPMMAHLSGSPFHMRVAADVLYLVIFPILFICKMEGYLPEFFARTSWVLHVTPLIGALFLALVASTKERSFEYHKRVIIDNSVNVWKERLNHLLTDSSVVGGTIAFLVAFAAYFDVEDQRFPSIVASFASPRLSIYLVFLPVWIALLIIMWMLPRLVIFYPDPDGGVRPYVNYVATTFTIILLYLLGAVVPLIVFCLKFDNFYAYARFVPEYACTYSGSALSQLQNLTEVVTWCQNNVILANFTSTASPLSSLPPLAGNATTAMVNVTAVPQPPPSPFNSGFPFHPYNDTHIVPTSGYAIIAGGNLVHRRLTNDIPHTSSLAYLDEVPIIAIVSPLIIAVLVVNVLSLMNARVHYSQLMRNRSAAQPVPPEGNEDFVVLQGMHDDLISGDNGSNALGGVGGVGGGIGGGDDDSQQEMDVIVGAGLSGSEDENEVMGEE